jgi:hypothetical protein
MATLAYEPARRRLCRAGQREKALAVCIITVAYNDARGGCEDARQWFTSADYEFWRDAAGVDDTLHPILD